VFARQAAQDKAWCQHHRFGAVQPGEEKAPRRPESGLSAPKEGTVRKKGTDSSAESVLIKQREMVSS